MSLQGLCHAQFRSGPSAGLATPCCTLPQSTCSFTVKSTRWAYLCAATSCVAVPYIFAHAILAKVFSGCYKRVRPREAVCASEWEDAHKQVQSCPAPCVLYSNLCSLSDLKQCIAYKWLR